MDVLNLINGLNITHVRYVISNLISTPTYLIQI